MRLAGAMRLVRFRGPGGPEPRLGLEVAPGGDALVDLSAAEPALPRSMREFLRTGATGLAAAQRWVPRARGVPQYKGGRPNAEVGTPVQRWVPP